MCALAKLNLGRAGAGTVMLDTTLSSSSCWQIYQSGMVLAWHGASQAFRHLNKCSAGGGQWHRHMNRGRWLQAFQIDRVRVVDLQLGQAEELVSSGRPVAVRLLVQGCQLAMGPP